ncbi:MAG: DMT family protein [Phycisphaerales bacterium]
MPKALITVLLLIGSNCFMTWAWYGHLKKAAWTIPVAIGFSWLIAFPEYLLQVPANRIGHISQGGPFTAAQLKILQEAITMVVFIVFSLLILKEKPRWNEGLAMVLIFAGVLVAMMGRGPMIEPEGGEAGAEMSEREEGDGVSRP